MAKDAKGHGSDGRGGSGGVGNFSRAQMIQNYSVMHGSTAIGDRAAASSLANGHPKSGAVPVHAGASGPSYNREAVNKAIASSNRAGRRIGGKEAGMIHALLKGRH